MTKTNHKRETKSFAFQVKAIDDEKGLIEAYGSVFDNTDQGNDVVRPGAFKRTIQNSKSRVQSGKSNFLAMMLWQHDEKQPIGGWTSLEEDSHGLLCKGQIILNTQLGKEAYELIKAGIINEFSIGYDIPSGGAYYDKSSGVRNLTELRLWEVSPVSFAMNTEALLVGVKDASQKTTGRHMTRKSKEMKTVQEHYAEEMCQDLLEDWADVFLCSLTSAVLDAFKIGDQPEQDISQALDDFKELVLTKFVPEAVECDLSGYLTDNSYSSADYTIHNGSDDGSYYGYMSSNRSRSAKLGKPISSTNQQNIDAHVKSIKALAKSAKAAMQDHANAMHDTADTVADLASGNSKSGRAISAATAQSLNSAADAMHDHADKAFDIMKEHTKAVRTAADDFANTMQGAEKPYDGDDPGKPDDDQQEGKSNPATPSQQEARSPQPHSQKSTVDEDERELELALASLLQELR